MATGAFELFYSYANEDERLLKKLDKHLSLLVRQGLIAPWNRQNVLAGTLWDQELREHLKTAHIILLLVSANFLASDYCYSVELNKAIKRHKAGDARVLPIILKPCDWEDAPFAQLNVLPSNRKPVTMWSNEDAAFANAAKSIRKVVNKMNGNEEPEDDEATGSKKKATKGGGAGRRDMARTPAEIKPKLVKKLIKEYNEALERYREAGNSESILRPAFHHLIDEVAADLNWIFATEYTLEGNIRPDGVLLDDFTLRRGYWEAKGPNSDLEKEIELKINRGYPLTNTIFENTKQAILYQGKKRVGTFDLEKVNDVLDLIRAFFTYVEPDIENFEEAVEEFKDRIPELAIGLRAKIEKGHSENSKFIAAFKSFANICRTSLDPNMSDETIDNMLIQHLLTERLFRTVFNNTDFVNRNVIAVEIEKVIQALVSKHFNRADFLQSLDRFYVAIERAAKDIDNWSRRQAFLNLVYERFFQGFSTKQADTHGIVYTPQEIVDFMVESVDEILKRDFGMSIETPGVKILDPATGTGNFVVNIMRHIRSRGALQKKYANDLYCNEIMLLPYYIASLNIEHEYYEKMKQYESFEGICFADSLELAEGKQLPLFTEKNTERVEKEKEADIMVVIGNPPYNVGQRNENDNNKNRTYAVVDRHISETYVKHSKASLKTQLYDAYVRFFRWATDRLGNSDGIICFVSNNSFLDGIAFDGFRKQVAEEFTEIYHLDLGGNARKQGGGNVFNIKLGVGITILVRKRKNAAAQKAPATIYYHKVDYDKKRKEKLDFLRSVRNFANTDWQILQPDKRYYWITEGINKEFTDFIPLGSKDAKSSYLVDLPVVFKTFSGGIKTNRDVWVYDFSSQSLGGKVQRLMEAYNTQLDQWGRRGDSSVKVDDFVNYDDKKIKWSEHLKIQLSRGKGAKYSSQSIRHSLYRPFTKQYLYLDPIVDDRQLLQHLFFPTSDSERENIEIIAGGYGRKEFAVFVANAIPDFNFYADPAQCFPFYVYSEDGKSKRENITDWVLKKFQDHYGNEVTKWDIFHCIYAMLQHPQYRALYREDLKRDLPHLPLLLSNEAFEVCTSVGKQLMKMHLEYEKEEEYPLEEIDNGSVPFGQLYRVEKMKLTSNKTALTVNKGLTLNGIPPECFEYRLGNRSALEWVIDQYQISTDERSGIVNDPNRLDDPEYIVRLVKQVVTVSVKTVELVKELTEAVTAEDWLGEQAEENVEETA